RELLGPGKILPGPSGEPGGQLGRLFLRGDGLVNVEHPRVPADLVADLDPALLQDGLREVRRWVAGGAPGGGGQDGAPVALDRPDLPAWVLDLDRGVVEDLAEELPDAGRVDPGRAEPGVDLSGCQVGRDHRGQVLDVDREPRVAGGGFAGDLQLVADHA